MTIAFALCVGAAFSVMGNAPGAAAAPYHPSIDTLKSWSTAMLKLMNRERLDHHVHSLTMNNDLIWAARAHDMKMADHNTMSHRLPGEADLAPRIFATGYANRSNWCLVAENVAWTSDISYHGGSGVKYLQEYMYNEAYPNWGHRLNILNPHLKDVGIRITYDSRHRKLWITQDFASKQINGRCP